MATLPALTKAYSTRANVPYPDNTTAPLLVRGAIWTLKAALMNQLSTGTLVGARHANSVWTCHYSCDGAVAGVAADGVDRWGSTWDATKVVKANNGSAHSWIVLFNTTLGLYLLIDCNSATDNTWRMSLSQVAFSGGTTTAGPTSAAPWMIGSNGADSAAATVTYHADVTALNNNFAHATFDNEGQFYFLTSRAGLGIFSACIAVVKSTGGHVSDTRNIFALHSTATTGRGALTAAAFATPAGCSSRLPNNSGVTTQGGGANFAPGATAYPGASGLDALSGDYLTFPCHVASITQVAYRGLIPDLYLIGTATVGASIPSTAAQERIVAGDVVMPFNTTVPTI